MDIQEAAMAKRPQTELQGRIESELQMHHEVSAKRRNGGPEDLGEIDRELTMASGALQGLFQRVGALAAALGPVMPGEVHSRLLQGNDFSRKEEWETTTEVGQRIATIRRSISECEDVLGLLVGTVRL